MVNAGPVARAGVAASAAVDDRMSEASAARFAIGEAIFRAAWQPAPHVSQGVDGLGPLYNAASCAACHGGPVLGFEGRVLRLSRPDGSPDPVYGRQLQDRAIAGHAAEGRIAIGSERRTVRFGDGREVELTRPVAAIADAAYGAPAADMAMSLRVPPPLDGLGFVAAIATADIRALADADDRDGDGISGRAGEAIDPVSGERVLARFGWKASVATLAQQTAEALHLDMGISSPRLLRASGDCTSAQVACMAAPDGASAEADGAEISRGEIDLLVAYLVGLPRPFRWLPLTHAPEPAGAREFTATGCAACHVPGFQAAEDSAMPHIAGQSVPLFSDLLLHDMGEGLADHRPEGSASGSEWRTAPLWGLQQRLSRIADGSLPGLLHDGRARSIEEAILWHGGEAARARDAFASLPASERDTLLSWLAGL
jgi:CxxC motif-containing protein (DUF1111 family)